MKVEKEIKEEWEKHLTQHIQSANQNIKELVKEYLEAKQAEERESANSNHKHLYERIKRDRAVEIVEFILSEKELAEKIRVWMENKNN